MILSIVLTILIGALIGWLAGILGIGGGLIVKLLIEVLGTCLLIAIVRLIMGKKF